MTNHKLKKSPAPNCLIEQENLKPLQIRKSPCNSTIEPEEKLSRFYNKMERIITTNLDSIDRKDMDDPLC